MMPSTVTELFRAGRLEDSVAAAAALVKTSPTNAEYRWLLAELLIVDGKTARAEQHLEAITAVEPRALVAVASIRNLLAADGLRRQFFAAGVSPTLPDGTEPECADYLAAFDVLRAGDALAAGTLAEQAETKRKPLPGRMNDRPFNDLRDGDDITASVFEVLTQAKQYLWVPMACVERLEFQRPKSPLDLIWRATTMVLKDGSESNVHLPAVYGTIQGADDASKLGRRTSWLGASGAAIVGVGQRVLLADGLENEDVSEVGLLSIETLSFE